MNNNNYFFIAMFLFMCALSTYILNTDHKVDIVELYTIQPLTNASSDVKPVLYILQEQVISASEPGLNIADD